MKIRRIKIVTAEGENLDAGAPVKAADFREMALPNAFFYWWFYFVPKRTVTVALKLIKKAFNFFSIDLLLKTLFQPWKRDEIDTTNMALDDKLRVWMMNLVSRLIGAVVRGGTIFIGLGAIALTVLAGLFLLLGFLILPIAAFYLLIQGFNFSALL